MVGGAAVTEEVFPDSASLRSAVVVSLPGGSSATDLPRHGLEILPLDGTSTDAEQRLPLARERSAKTHRRSRVTRSSTPGADEYGKAMVEMARCVNRSST